MITTLKDLERLLKLCRKQGVTDLKMGDLELKLGDLPTEQRSSSEQSENDDPLANFPDRILSPEELAFYSAGGRPDDEVASEGQ